LREFEEIYKRLLELEEICKRFREFEEIEISRQSFPPLSVRKLDRRHTGRLRKRDILLTGDGGSGWERSRII
jgi:hypothetical protein